MEHPFRLEPDLASLLHSLEDDDLRAFASVQEELAEHALMKLCVLNFNPCESLYDSPDFLEAPESDADSELYIYMCFLVFIRSDSKEYFDKASQQMEMWHSLTPNAHPDRKRRSQLKETMSESMKQRKDCFEHLDERFSRRMYFLSDESVMLARNYEVSGDRNDLEEAIRLISQGTEQAQPDHPGLPPILANQVIMLQKHYKRVKDVDYLKGAVDNAKKTLEIQPRRFQRLADSLDSLGSLLDARFERTQTTEDLIHAVKVRTMALDTTPTNSPEYLRRTHNLGVALIQRFGRTGALEDLDQAVERAKTVLKETSSDSPERPTRLNQLAISLAMRYHRTGVMDDLEGAIRFATMATDTVADDDDSFASCHVTLSNALVARYQRIGKKDDLDGAVTAANKAVDKMTLDDPARPDTLHVLAICLGMQSGKSRKVEDLDRAIEITRLALKNAPPDNPNRAKTLNTLANQLTVRMGVDGKTAAKDLDEAIEAAKTAVTSTPVDHPERAVWWGQFGDCLMHRWAEAQARVDLIFALGAYMEGWMCVNAPPSNRIEMATKAAVILGSEDEWERSYQHLQQALDLLPQLSPRSLKNIDKQYMLKELKNLAATAAEAALRIGKEASHALQLLEQGRGVIAGLLMEMREDLTDLEQKHPDLAEEFVSLRDKLDSSENLSESGLSSWQDTAKQRVDTDRKFSALLERIRGHDGFHNFLRPPTTDELMSMAAPDPIVVVYVSSFRSHAFLIEFNQIRAVELPLLKIGTAREYVQNLRRSRLSGFFNVTPVLEWLWDAICHPCLDALGFTKPITNDNWPHVWWVPTGILSQLPLHAAGRMAPGSGDTVLDRVMSSYASSVKALLYSRRQHTRKATTQVSYEKALLIAMTDTQGLPGSGHLEFVAKEVQMLENMCPSLELKPVSPPPRKSEVLRELSTCRIFHFAGHGKSDPTEPSRSSLLLEDWQRDPLTVADLRDHRLQDNPPFLGYLSACSTGTNEADVLVDEGIHLVSAFQLAGFRHVIGTLWEVSDSHCVDVARVIYQTIQREGITDKAVCRGLHRAIRALRDGRVKEEIAGRNATLLSFGLQAGRVADPFWVPYIHFGV